MSVTYCEFCMLFCMMGWKSVCTFEINKPNQTKNNRSVEIQTVLLQTKLIPVIRGIPIVQDPDISWSKPFKAAYKEQYENWMANSSKELTHAFIKSNTRYLDKACLGPY